MMMAEGRGSKYEKRDWEIIDYHVTDLLIGEEPYRVRQPVPENLNKGGYGVCIGAAQTYGPFVERPYPALLNDELGFPVINLGRGGASALSFLSPALIDFINQGRFAVVQIMSARGVENSLFRPADWGGQNNIVLKETGENLKSQRFYKDLLAGSNTDLIVQIISESRQNWIKDYQELLTAIRVPKILFWFSQRAPDYQEKFKNLRRLYSKYPQLVNREMVEIIKPSADAYVECISRSGLPQKLVGRLGGAPRLHRDNQVEVKEENKYYPSPEMHQQAAQVLLSVCGEYVPRS